MQTDHEIAAHFGLETAAVRRLINSWCEKLPSDVVYDAIAKAVRYKARSWRYVVRILNSQIPRQTELKPQRVPSESDIAYINGMPTLRKIPDWLLKQYLADCARSGIRPRSEYESRACGWCGNLIPESKRSDSLYCSNRCRLYAHRSRDNQ